ncbi:MAG TPA: hypothetical protein VGK33_01480 [Chloroflexota bacterium]|jgi:hypothetical protein
MASLPIHATNAWNPTGHDLQPVDGTRLFYAHVDALNGPRTVVLLGDQKHLTFVADLEGTIPPNELRSVVVDQCGVYPHLVDQSPRARVPAIGGLPWERRA